MGAGRGREGHEVGLLLGEQGAARSQVAKLTVYVATADRAVLGAVWQALDGAFDQTPPAIVVGVTVLPYPEQLVEIDAVIAGAQP